MKTLSVAPLRHCAIAALAMLSLIGCDNRPVSNTNKSAHIGITQIATHPGIDAIRKGFIEEMAKLGYQEGKDVTYDQSNAQGDMPRHRASPRNSRSNDVTLFSPSAHPLPKPSRRQSRALRFP